MQNRRFAQSPTDALTSLVVRRGLPLSGCVFSMRVDVPGLPGNFWVD